MLGLYALVGSETVCMLGPTCMISASSWQNVAFAPQSGSCTAEFDATPNNAAMDGVMGLSNGPAAAYTSLAAIVRFNTSGMIDARNGGAYAASAAIPYSAGTTYHVRLVVSVPAHTYSVYVRSGSDAEQLLASNFSFRTEQALASALNNLGLYASVGSETVCKLAVVPAVTSAGSWQNIAFVPQSDSFVAEFDATPNNAAMDGVMGLSNGPAAAYSSLAAIVRFNTSGMIDARNGGAYAASAAVPYSAGTTYHFRLVVSVPAHTYSVYVRSGSNVEQLLASNFSFRTEQALASALNNLGLYASVGSKTVCNLAVGPAVTSAGSWQNVAFAPQSGSCTAEFDATPQNAAMDGVMGLSNGPATDYSSLAAIVRFNTSGMIDARNGGAYAASAAIPYSAGTTYHFRLVVIVPAHTYSVYVRSGSNAEQLLASNFSFRTEQALASALNNLGLYASVGSETVYKLVVTVVNDTTPPLVSMTAPGHPVPARSRYR